MCRVHRALFATFAITVSASAAGAAGYPEVIEPTRAFPEDRVALVVGNADYSQDRLTNPGGVPDLTNPIKDARAIRDMLAGLGFRIVYGEDLPKREMERAMAQFASIARGSVVAVTYFAGHGATFNDTPYLIPVDAQFESLESVTYELIRSEDFIAELRRASGVRVALIDACRDNAKEQQLKREDAAGGEMRGGEPTRGLARVPHAEGLIIAYATQFLTTASDGAADNSPFAAALVETLPRPGVDIRQALFNVADAVVQATGNTQRPEISVSLFTPFILVPAAFPGAAAAEPPRAIVVEPTPAPTIDREVVFWNSIANSTNPADFQAYLNQFPNGTFFALARNRIRDLAPPQLQRVAYHYVGPVSPPDPWLALRTEPSSRTGRRLAQMPQDTMFQVTGQRSMADGIWYNVRLRNGATGWAHSDYIRCCKYSSN